MSTEVADVTFVDTSIVPLAMSKRNYQLVTCPPLNRQKVPELFNNT